MSERVVTRRGLLGGGSALAMGLLLGASGARGEEMTPEYAALQDEAPLPPVNVAVIGLGEQGRELLTSLTYVNGAVVKYVCDVYVPAHKRAQEIVPKAVAVEDYKKVLDDKDVAGVFVATPSHLHKQIVLDALAAGKSVYCEAPLASSIDDAREIAKAGMGVSGKQVFQAGLQSRVNRQHHHVKHFVDSGALGQNIARVQAQWNKKTSWRRSAPSDARQNALNWRLNKSSSGGLMGEVGIHQVDVATWFLKSLPVSVSGFGGINQWKDGRDVADTVTCVFEYPGGVRLTYDATLANSFAANFELFQGTDAAALLRDARAWLFKEADSTPLGWEVYARREQVGDETGIMLVADASKLLALGKSPSDFAKPDPKRSPLFYACDGFLNGIRSGGKPMDDGYYTISVPGAKEGFAATVIALKANEAIVSGTKIALTKEMLTV